MLQEVTVQYHNSFIQLVACGLRNMAHTNYYEVMVGFRVR